MNVITYAGGVLLALVFIMAMASELPMVAGIMDSLPIVHWLAVIGVGMLSFGFTRSWLISLIIVAAAAAALAMGWIPI